MSGKTRVFTGVGLENRPVPRAVDRPAAKPNKPAVASGEKTAGNALWRDRYYPDTSATVEAFPKKPEDVIDDCLVVLDTKALTLPYKISKNILDAILDVHANWLIVPGQVAREFAANRGNEIARVPHQEWACWTSCLSQPNMGEGPDHATLHHAATPNDHDRRIPWHKRIHGPRNHRSSVVSGQHRNRRVARARRVFLDHVITRVVVGEAQVTEFTSSLAGYAGAGCLPRLFQYGIF